VVSVSKIALTALIRRTTLIPQPSSKNPDCSHSVGWSILPGRLRSCGDLLEAQVPLTVMIHNVYLYTLDTM